jgi:hypothetical protein
MAREWVMPPTVTARCSDCAWAERRSGSNAAAVLERRAGEHARAQRHTVRLERLEEKTIDGRGGA